MSNRPLAPLVWVALALAVYPLSKRAVISHRDVGRLGVDTYEHEYAQGVFLARHPQPGAVMVVDLGAPAYLSDAHLVDVGGLGSLDVARPALSGSTLTPELFRQLAAAHDVRIALDLTTTIDQVPAEWIRVARWEAPDGGVNFFAIDEPSAERLLRDPPRV